MEKTSPRLDDLKGSRVRRPVSALVDWFAMLAFAPAFAVRAVSVRVVTTGAVVRVVLASAPPPCHFALRQAVPMNARLSAV